VGRMWPGLVDWARSALLSTDPPLANADDLEIPRCVDSADEAIALIRTEHSRWLAELGLPAEALEAQVPPRLQ